MIFTKLSLVWYKVTLMELLVSLELTILVYTDLQDHLANNHVTGSAQPLCVCMYVCVTMILTVGQPVQRLGNRVHCTFILTFS